MDDLVQFLRDRLDEDQAFALEAPQGPWRIGNAVDPTQPCNVHTFPGARMVADGLHWLVAEHIARHDPARVLREVEAKRLIIAEHDIYARPLADRVDCQSLDFPCKALRLLALPWADHPDYRSEWAS